MTPRIQSHYDRQSVGQSVLVSAPIWDPRPIFPHSLFDYVLDSSGFVDVRLLVLATAARYIASTQTAQETRFPILLLLLNVTRSERVANTILMLLIYGYYLAAVFVQRAIT
jgi:hypothetical protein